ncbi:uncharacterized protein LOC125178099 [Hyalella azteca]|uniref:Uncharacterized protein LOC125178099 n=1 Tax=Hyalella azteca TaxID=294128 RepID=A0A979FKK9_HYAAZ|nr:uncharacterized protein LOC125178099 [Hyalella azteca]
MTSAHVFWPPLTFLVMSIAVIMFIILKWGDKLCKARTVPFAQNYEIEDHSSENTTYLGEVMEEKSSYKDLIMGESEMIGLQEKKSASYECAV